MLLQNPSGVFTKYRDMEGLSIKMMIIILVSLLVMDDKMDTVTSPDGAVVIDVSPDC